MKKLTKEQKQAEDKIRLVFVAGLYMMFINGELPGHETFATVLDSHALYCKMILELPEQEKHSLFKKIYPFLFKISEEH